MVYHTTEHDACRLYRSTLIGKGERWRDIPEQERQAFRDLAADANILHQHYSHWDGHCVDCRQKHPCQIRRFLTLPDLFERGQK